MKTISLSEPKPVKLKSYEFDPKDLSAIISQYDSIDPAQDIKSAKKARTVVKSKIAEIKRIHTSNKKIIKDFQGELVAYDLQKFQTLTQGLTDLYDKLDQSINNIENQAVSRERDIFNRMSGIQLSISEKIMNARTEEQIQEIQIEISGIEITAALYDNNVANMESIKTKLMMNAANRALEIANAGGTIPDHKVDPISMGPTTIESNQKYTDGELLNAMEIMGIPGKGWVAMAGSNGFALYQVDDHKAPKSVRMALQIALEEHKSKTV
jgi:tartrate dehydratase beta subunit/fumarate hydratase class I family protein